MERQPTKSNLVLGLCHVFIKLVFHVGSTVGDGRKLITNDNKNLNDFYHPGFISIDCGAANGYKDEETGIWYETDAEFIETGDNSKTLESINLDYPHFGGLLTTLRSFPEGKRNCYTLKPEQGNHHTYLIRAIFAYGNYDGKNQTPTFDLYLGVNHWDTVELGDNDDYRISEVIHTPTTDTIHVCLVRSDIGVPFISSLELRPLTNSIYQTSSSPSESLLISRGRFDVASTSFTTHSRYKDDIYDRMWGKMISLYWYQINGSVDIDPSTTEDPYKLPVEVLKSAARSDNLSYPLQYDFDSMYIDLDKSSKYLTYFHFCEVEQLPPGHKRILNITFGDENVFSQQPIVLEYLKPQTIALPNASQGYVRFNIRATSESDAPPILNAFEVYRFISPLPSTDQRDVDAVMDIKDTYRISNLDWQGDPCVPDLVWDGLDCSYLSRITSMNLSMTKLTGQITNLFSQLTELESLDLSFNDLSGSIPEFLAELPKLRVLNLSGNKLTGSIPKSLKEKSSYGNLELSLSDNPGLCLVDLCKKQKSVIPLASSVSALAVIFLVSLGVWIFKKKKLKGRLKQKKLLQEIGDIARPFSISGKRKCSKSDKTNQEIHIFNFKSIALASDSFSSTNKLGEGGFGPVYKGRLLDGREIAIKRLSKCSKQGLTEFKNEVKLIAKLQHTNLVRLYGFCIEGEENMLIYEYLPNKSLDFYLFDHNNRILLNWKTRLRIIQGIAQGLVYLHKYSRVKVIHRDLKPSNILLDHEMCPKISDFGMARIFGLKEFEQENTNRVVGTYGYMAPEYALNGIVSVKADIFSFGVLMLEIVSGRKNVSFYNCEDSLNLIGHAWKLGNEGRALELADPSLSGTWNAAELLRCIQIGLLCVQDEAKDRPDMLDVVSYLSNETISLAEPKQPAFFIKAIQNRATSSTANIPENFSTCNVTISDFNGR